MKTWATAHRVQAGHYIWWSGIWYQNNIPYRTGFCEIDTTNEITKLQALYNRESMTVSLLFHASLHCFVPRWYHSQNILQCWFEGWWHHNEKMSLWFLFKYMSQETITYLRQTVDASENVALSSKTLKQSASNFVHPLKNESNIFKLPKKALKHW